jgi:hypothetical protein
MMMMMMMMTICKDLPFTLHNKQKHERVYLNLHTSIIFSLSLSLFKHQIQRSREINVFASLILFGRRLSCMLPTFNIFETCRVRREEEEEDDVCYDMIF